MKATLVMALFSRRVLTAPVARRQIDALSKFAEGLMCPDEWNVVDPIKIPFDRGDISAPVSLLAQPNGRLFYRKGKPIYMGGQIWNLTHPPEARFPGRLFANYWTGQFDGKWALKVGIEKIEDFVVEMFRVSGSDFGLLTTEVDLKAKNTKEPIVSYQGKNLDLGIPGLYWVNLFSDGLAEWLGLGGLSSELAESKRLEGGGLSLKFCESSDDCRDYAILQKQRAVIEWPGPNRFFDIHFPDRKLETPNWDLIPRRNS